MAFVVTAAVLAATALLATVAFPLVSMLPTAALGVIGPVPAGLGVGDREAFLAASPMLVPAEMTPVIVARRGLVDRDVARIVGPPPGAPLRPPLWGRDPRRLGHRVA